MKITRYKADPKQPYSLHDFRINGMDFIPPAQIYQNLAGIKGEQWLDLIAEIEKCPMKITSYGNWDTGRSILSG